MLKFRLGFPQNFSIPHFPREEQIEFDLGYRLHRQPAQTVEVMRSKASVLP